MSDLFHTPLHDLHLALGAKVVPFAGYAMPVQYPMGVLQEHLHTRNKAGLFDVSHMGQVIIKGANYRAVATALETLIPIDILGLDQDRQRYGFFTNDAGGILDDLMLANRGDHIFMVTNLVYNRFDAVDLASLTNKYGCQYPRLWSCHVQVYLEL